MLHGDGVSFMSLHGIQNLSLHSLIIHKNYLCLHDTHRKRAVVYTISRPIFWNSYTIIQECLFGLSGLEGEFLGLGLWYIAKELRYLQLKRHTDKKTGRVSALFSLSANHSLLSVKFLLNRSNCPNRIGKSENPFFLSVLASMTSRWM